MAGQSLGQAESQGRLGETSLLEKRIRVRTGVGLHARPAARLVAEAARYSCEVTLEYGGRVADAKSILQVLALGVKDGHEILVRAEGDREAEVLAALAACLDASAESGGRGGCASPGSSAAGP
jgi:phosphotransferase system HPr (HPr) family protein